MGTIRGRRSAWLLAKLQRPGYTPLGVRVERILLGATRTMLDPQDVQDSAMHIVLHAWVELYFRGRVADSKGSVATFSTELQTQASKLQESALALAAAVEKMRIANAKLAQRMAEHRAFFAKYRPAE